MEKGVGKYSRANLYPGAIFESNFCGKFKLICPVLYNLGKDGMTEIGRKDPRYLIEFLDTGFMTYASRPAILSGRVRDKTLPIIAGVGSLGANIKLNDPYVMLFYRSWNDMMHRCYNPDDTDFCEYGALGVSVEPRWHIFYNYLNDMPQLPNFDKKLAYPNDFQLDKDYLQLNIPKNQRIYSRQTCMFLSKFDNMQVMAREKSIEMGNKYFGVRTNFDPKDKTRIISYTARITLFGSLDFHNDSAKKYTKTRSLANFKTDLAAASLFNYVYPFLTRNIPFHEFNILNNIVPIPYDELPNYIFKQSKNDWFNDYPTWSTVLANWK